MDRLRPERRPRQRVQKVWRSVCWADSFSDESLIMDTIDISPDFALRRIATLFENKKYDECASLIRRLNSDMVKSILKEVPIDVIHESLPHSACILEALYIKVYQSHPESFPTTELHVDQLTRKMVCILARQYSNKKPDKNSNMFLPSFRTVLRIIMSVQPSFRQQIAQKKKGLDQCLRRLGQHGMVDSSGERLMTLHNALKLELENVVAQYKTAIQKMDELSLSARHPTSSSVTSGKAPTNASHQRLMQVTRSDVQDRLIKNKTLLNVVEPSITSQYLKQLISILQKRIEYDKLMLLHDTELRKMSGQADDDVYLSITLRQFSQGYAAMLHLLREITGEEFTEEMNNGNVSSSEDDTDHVTGTPVRKPSKTARMNGVIPTLGGGQTPNHADTGNDSVGSLPLRLALSTNAVTTGSPSYRWQPPEISSPNSTRVSGLWSPGHQSMEQTTSFTSAGEKGDLSRVEGDISRDMTSSQQVAALEKEVQRLRQELSSARDHIQRLELRDRQTRQRLSEQAYKQFSVNNGSFENVSLGSQRPTELIRQYGNLYTDGRVDAMDALTGLSQLGDLDVLKMKILFSVIVLAFRAVNQSLQDLRSGVRQMLNIPVTSGNLDPPSRDLQRHIDQYLSQTSDRFDLAACVQDVCSQIYATLFDYPCLKECPVLVDYIRECVRLAWGLSVQNPPYVIVYDSKTFSAHSHTRFHTSDPEIADVQCFLWPILVEQQTGAVLHKGVVIT